MSHEPPDRLPWHVPVKVDDIPEGGRHFALIADGATRAAVADFADVRSVEKLEASFDVARKGRGGLRVTGEIQATIGQICVVTLETIDNTVAETVDVDFVPPPVESTGKPAESVGAKAGDDEAPEFLVDGGVDLGALAVEFLILGIDPHPRKPGVDFATPPSEPGENGPFAVLAKLKPGPDKGN